MPTGLFARAVFAAAVVAAVAAGGVWLLTVATFEPQVLATVGPDGEVADVDNRWYCSGGWTIPYTLDGVRVEPTMPPHCHGGPIHAESLGPSPLPAIATFLLAGTLALFIVGAMLGSHDPGPGD